MISAEQLIKQYELIPHPEGGFFKRTYCSSDRIAEKDRPVATAIYYLLPQGAKSLLHRLKSDEMWHFYLGGSLTIVEITPGGSVLKTRLGQDVFKGDVLQHLVPAGNWFGVIAAREQFSFVGCTVAPGFDFADFELADRSMLVSQFPNSREIIELLTVG